MASTALFLLFSLFLRPVALQLSWGFKAPCVAPESQEIVPGARPELPAMCHAAGVAGLIKTSHLAQLAILFQSPLQLHACDAAISMGSPASGSCLGMALTSLDPKIGVLTVQSIIFTHGINSAVSAVFTVFAPDSIAAPPAH